MIPLKFLKLSTTATIPAYQTAGAACFDLHADLPDMTESVSLPPHHTQIIPTGLAVEIPEGYVLQIYSRSGHGFKTSVRLSNCVGIIDSDYRGELMVKLVCDGPGTGHPNLAINHGDRIAQAMLVKLPKVEIVEVDSLTETNRGAGGLGSTGS